jgi:uncharacterized membrane protein required for colicin V production
VGISKIKMYFCIHASIRKVNMELQIVDYIMLALLVLMTIMGLMRGIVRQIGDLAALILGVVGANIWGGEASLWVQTYL